MAGLPPEPDRSAIIEWRDSIPPSYFCASEMPAFKRFDRGSGIAYVQIGCGAETDGGDRGALDRIGNCFGGIAFIHCNACQACGRQGQDGNKGAVVVDHTQDFAVGTGVGVTKAL